MGERCQHNCDPGDYDYCTVWRERTVRARRTWRCCECGCEIPHGTFYIRTTNLFEGEWQTFQTCLICNRIRGDHCYNGPIGRLREVLRDCLGIDYVTNELAAEAAGGEVKPR